ncbi:MAG: chaperonin GroEL [Blautia sp.]|jgi:chaperonin GroEL
MAVRILHEKEIKFKMLAGVTLLSDIVAPTLGPGEKSALVRQESGIALISSSGTEAASSLILQDSFENIGVQVIKKAASTVKEQAGDGSATTIVLADHILKRSLSNIASGANPVELRRGIQAAAQLGCAAIKKISKPFQPQEDIHKMIALSGLDPSIGGIIAEAFDKVGDSGIIKVEESPELEPSVTTAEGMHYEKGYTSSQFLSEKQSLTEELKEPFILVTDQEISNPYDLIPVLEAVSRTGRPLLIIADHVTDAVLSLLIVNKKNGKINSVVAHPPAYGDGRKEQLEDISIYSGGTFLSAQLGYSVKNATLDMLGSAQKVLIDAHRTVILNGKSDSGRLKQHISGLRAQYANTDYAFQKGRIAERLAKLQTGAAVIYAGASTETEMKGQKILIENTVNTVKSAWKGGVVPGGGVVYLDIQKPIRAYANTLSGDLKTGAEILISALQAPIRQIALNSGASGEVVVSKLETFPRGYGYNVITGEYLNMFQTGIIDSAEAAYLALQCASSAASMLITTEAGIIRI